LIEEINSFRKARRFTEDGIINLFNAQAICPACFPVPDFAQLRSGKMNQAGNPIGPEKIKVQVWQTVP